MNDPETADTATVSKREIDPITGSSCDDLTFYGGATCHKRWALRATTPLLYPRP
ncbi:hypothetical protein AVEN_170189-1, partial [Araneus ventricosus]